MNTNIYLTHTGIKAFNDCKRFFKNKYIDNINYAKRDINNYLSFDISLHSTLADFNKLTSASDKTFNNLLALLNKNWISKGYNSYFEEQHFNQKAINTIKNYYLNPLDIGAENVVIDKILKRQVSNNFILKGKVDKFHELKDGSYEFIDYKTGSTIPLKADMNLNIRIPVIIALIHSTYGVYPDLVSYYYLIYNKKFTIKIDDAYIEFAKKYLNFITNEIEQEKLYNCCKRPCSNIGCKYFKICSKQF